MGTGRGWIAGVLAAAVVVGAACGLERRGTGEDDLPEFSAARLGYPGDDVAAFDVLTPAEREAARRSGLGGLELEGDEDAAATAEPAEETRLDRAGKLGLSLLTVGLSLAAAAAPFLLF